MEEHFHLEECRSFLSVSLGLPIQPVQLFKAGSGTPESDSGSAQGFFPGVFQRRCRLALDDDR